MRLTVPDNTRQITAFPGLYVAGYPWLSDRGSGILHGVADDAVRIAQHIAANARGGPGRLAAVHPEAPDAALLPVDLPPVAGVREVRPHLDREVGGKLGAEAGERECSARLVPVLISGPALGYLTRRLRNWIFDGKLCTCRARKPFCGRVLV